MLRKILATLLITSILLCTLSLGALTASAAYSGTWGNLTWTLDNAGKLTISGEGEMDDTYYTYDAWRSYNDSIKTVVIEDGVTSIGGYAFYNCYFLTSVTIGNSVAVIGVSVFSYCSSLKSIDVNSGNTAYCDVDGVLFNKDKTTLIQYPIGNTNTSYAIPVSVTTIGDDAFYNCDSLESVTIPNSVTSIGDSAFKYCDCLNSVTIGNSVTVIGDYAFGGCTSLTSVTIPASVITIGNRTFRGCSSLESITIPDGVTVIGNDAFYNTSYYNNENNWEDEVLYIGKHLIEAKTSIAGDYSIKEGTKCIADEAFGVCTSLTSVTIPASVITIGNDAFSWCSSLDNITIPDSVTTIGGRAFIYTKHFYDESNWENDVLYIGQCLIMAKMSIAGDYSIKEGTKCIADEAFSSCHSLNSIIIPDGVVSIGNRVFYNCTFSSITIPKSVTSIGDGAFSDCWSLSNITIPDSVTSIGEGAFSYCYSLTSVTIPASVTTIGDYAFSDCIALKTVYYGGSEDQWNDIEIDDGNANLLNANIIYSSTEPETEKGDVNGDEYVDNTDAIMVLKYDAGIIDLSDDQVVTADVNEDGYADNTDAIMILKYDAGIIDEL